MTISIPLSFIFFPITIPILLVRIVVASICTIVFFPVPTTGSVRGWKTNYKILSKQQHGQDTVREVLITPGWIPRIGGLSSQLVTIWKLLGRFPDKWCYSNGHMVPDHVRHSIQRAEELADCHAREEKNIRERLERIKLRLSL